MRVLSVQDVTVTRVGENPLRLYIEAWGQAATSGWTNPRLDGASDTNPADAVLEFGFEADRPGGIVPQVLTPIYAAAEVKPNHGADAVIVQARTNCITVHASEFLAGHAGASARRGLRVTTMALGEESPVTTLAVGEEGATLHVGEDPPVTTLRLGEEGPTTDPRLDDPAGNAVVRGPFGRF